MKSRQQILVIFATVTAVGIVGIFTVDIMMNTDRIEWAAPWHQQFESKKECTNFMKDVLGNSSSQANAMCNKVLPH